MSLTGVKPGKREEGHKSHSVSGEMATSITGREKLKTAIRKALLTDQY
jgi:hypothetical protein